MTILPGLLHKKGSRCFLLPDIDHHIFGFAAGLEFDFPTGDAGCDDKVCIPSLFQSVGLVVCSHPHTYRIHGDHLTSVGVPGKHQIHACSLFAVIIVGLMIQDHLVFVVI